MRAPARILIVDDDPTAILILQNALEGLGETRTASGGVEALAQVEKGGIDLVLLDALMPSLDGFTTCGLLQKDHPELPVIFVTVVSDYASEVRALDAGAVDFISKPISPPVVRARVKTQLKLKAQNDLLRSLSSQDPLTGIANRRALDERLTMEWRRALRNDQPLSLLMIDIDHFKAYNDHFGHARGDECLLKVAQNISTTLTRGGDFVARYGGEEFAALLASTKQEEATGLAEKIRAHLRDLAIPHAPASGQPYVSLSIGVATSPPFSQAQLKMGSLPNLGKDFGLQLAQDLFARADHALYAAKAAGRNRVCSAKA